MTSKEYKKLILDKISEQLKENNFKKKGNLFSYSNGDLTYFIGFQSSQSSTREILKVTVNTEIASAIISGLEDISLPIEHQRHYNRRIGSYLSPDQDKWWVIDDNESANNAANEIAEIIIDKILPNFDVLRTTEDLANLWRTGGYIGITEAQRENYLSLLESKAK